MSLRRHIAIKVTKVGNTLQCYPDLGTPLCITHCCLTQSSVCHSHLPSKKQAAVLMGNCPELSPPLLDWLNKTLGDANSVNSFLQHSLLYLCSTAAIWDFCDGLCLLSFLLTVLLMSLSFKFLFVVFPPLFFTYISCCFFCLVTPSHCGFCVSSPCLLSLLQGLLMFLFPTN